MKDFPWFKHYPEGVAQEINLYDFDSLIDLFEVSCKKYATRVAFENMGKTLTFQELDTLTQDFAAFLQEGLGLQKGERIAIQMPNLLQFPIAFFGALRAGLIVVNTNPLYTPREMEHQFKDADISAIVIVANFASHLEKVMLNMSIKHVIVTELGDMLGGFKGSLVNFVVKHIKKMVPTYHLPLAHPFKSALKKGASLHYTKPTITNEDVAVLQYTGGTTGVSKGAQLSHGNIVAHNSMITEWFKPYMNSNGNDLIITAIPMYHIFALTVNGILMFSTGVKNVLITNPRDMKGFVKELKKQHFTIFTGVRLRAAHEFNSPTNSICPERQVREEFFKTAWNCCVTE